MSVDKAAILAEMIALTTVERQQAGDVTVTDYIEALPEHDKIGRPCAVARLRGLCKTGAYSEHKVQLDSGVIGYVYRPVKAAA